MTTDCCSGQNTSPYWLWAGLIYLIVNIRVEAGLATPPERILDGSVALYVFALLLSTGAKFFHLIEVREHPLPGANRQDGNRSRTSGRRSRY